MPAQAETPEQMQNALELRQSELNFIRCISEPSCGGHELHRIVDNNERTIERATDHCYDTHGRDDRLCRLLENNLHQSVGRLRGLADQYGDGR